MSQADRNLAVYNKVLSKDQSVLGIFTHTEGGTYDPVTEITTDPVVTTPGCVIIFVKASKNEATPDDYQLERGDRVLICAAKGEVPVHGDFFTLNSDNWTIFTVVESSAGDNSLFRCFVKKG